MIDRWLEVIDVEASTKQGYVRKIGKHIRSTLGTMQVGKLDAEILESFYAQLRKCRDHCGSRKYIEHPRVRRACVRRDSELPADAYVFSRSPDGSTPLIPDSVTQRYDRMTRKLKIETTLHTLRHYSATELIAAGVDVRTVAGRLGHSGGGATTLRVYPAWNSEADQRAARFPPSRVILRDCMGAHN